MSKQRIHRKLMRSPEEIAAEKEVQEKFQKERPTLGQLIASGDYTEPVTQEEYWDIRRITLLLKKMRETQGLSLAKLSAATGMDRAAISRLETGVLNNPTVNTLCRYARAVGKRIVVRVVDIPKNVGKSIN